MAEKVWEMPALGDRRPSQLLAAMLEYCPKGESDSAFFRASYFCRLPKEIRVLMADEVNRNLKDLASRVDELFQHKKSAVVAAVQNCSYQDENNLSEVVAALYFKGGRNFQHKKKGAEKSGGQWQQQGDGSRPGGSSNIYIYIYISYKFH